MAGSACARRSATGASSAPVATPTPRPVVDAGAAFELLQAFALVHDDVMDGSSVRRGARTAHLAYGDRHARRRRGGARCAASARGWRSSSATWPTCTPIASSPARTRTCKPCGTSCAPSSTSASTSTCGHGQRATSTTTAPGGSPATSPASTRSSARSTSAPRWPAGSTELQGPLSAYGDPLGEAFQLRDDMLGAFGDEATHRQARRRRPPRGQAHPAARVATAAADGPQAEVLSRDRSRPTSTAAEIEAIQQVFVDTGAVEADRGVDRRAHRPRPSPRSRAAPITAEAVDELDRPRPRSSPGASG